jgi:chromosome segregation ATPase
MMLKMIGLMIFSMLLMFAMAVLFVAPVIVMATDAHAGRKPAEQPLWMQVRDSEKSLAKCVDALDQVEAQFGECSRGFGEVNASLEICEDNLHGQAAALALMAANAETLRKEKKDLEAVVDRLQKDLKKAQKKLERLKPKR